jgi:hypothetical protein
MASIAVEISVVARRRSLLREIRAGLYRDLGDNWTMDRSLGVVSDRQYRHARQREDVLIRLLGDVNVTIYRVLSAVHAQAEDVVLTTALIDGSVRRLTCYWPLWRGGERPVARDGEA